MPQPPDFSPADFFLFPKLKTPMKVKRFATIQEVKEKSTEAVMTIQKSTCIISEWAKVDKK